MTALAWRLLRGPGAAALVAAALRPPAGPPWAALLLLRGCPMCCLLGLADHLRALSNQRG